MSSTYGKECIIEEWTSVLVSNFYCLRVRIAGSCSVIVLFRNREGYLLTALIYTDIHFLRYRTV